jgi:DUF4097 and DUF4098 domain-containing protein YvlB
MTAEVRLNGNSTVSAQRIALSSIGSNPAASLFKIRTWTPTGPNTFTYGDLLTIRTNNGNVGIGTDAPNAKLQVVDGDAAVSTQGNGLILKATNGSNCFRVTVNNAGTLSTASVTCP